MQVNWRAWIAQPPASVLVHQRPDRPGHHGYARRSLAPLATVQLHAYDASRRKSAHPVYRGREGSASPLILNGNHVKVIAKDGRVLESSPGTGADLSTMEFTVTVAPGETIDGIFQWTGEKLGWDIYGHAPGDPLEPNEYAPDHGKPVPTTVPNPIDVFPSTMYSGSPYLGTVGFLPPGGAGQLNPTGAYFFMWHSHNEDEIVNFNIFPGGMMTMSMVEHPMMPIMPDLSSN